MAEFIYIKKILSVLLICTGLVPVCLAVTAAETSQQKRPSAWELLRKYTEQQAKVTVPRSKERVVHFPKDRSLGKLFVRDRDFVRQVDTSIYWADKAKWQYFAKARGNVKIPVGKRVWLQISSPVAWQDLSPLKFLRPDDLYRLDIYGSFTGGPRPDDRCMQHIAALTGLKVLELRYTDITGRGIKVIEGLESLERLTLPERIDNAGMVQVAKLKSLKGLYWTENRVTNRGLRHLTELTSLEELALGGDHIGNSGLVHVAKLPHLRYLMLWGKNFTDDGMVCLQNFPSLKILHLGGLSNITDAGLEHLSHISRLEIISFYWNENITDRGMAHLKRLPALRKLKINRSKVTDEGLAHLKEVKSLEYLGLPAGGITDQGLAHLAQLENLRYLNVGCSSSGSAITDAGLEHLSGLKALKELKIGGKGITSRGMSQITKLSGLRSLMLYGCPQLTDKGLARLTSLKSLKKLYINSTKVTITGLAELNSLPNLTDLNVRQIKRGSSVLAISGLTNLEKLTLGFESRSGDSLTDADLACLAKLKRLRSLQIPHKGISNAGLKHLAGLTSLEHLSVGGKLVTDDGLAHLANMQKLSSLILTGNFTDIGLRHLERLKALVKLDFVAGANFSPGALNQFRKKMPHLVSFETHFKEGSPRRPQGTRPTRPKSRR
jgi:Leucine-rich repeat (LRR) protein